MTICVLSLSPLQRVGTKKSRPAKGGRRTLWMAFKNQSFGYSILDILIWLQFQRIRTTSERLFHNESNLVVCCTKKGQNGGGKNRTFTESVVVCNVEFVVIYLHKPKMIMN